MGPRVANISVGLIDSYTDFEKQRATNAKYMDKFNLSDEIRQTFKQPKILMGIANMIDKWMVEVPWSDPNTDAEFVSAINILTVHPLNMGMIMSLTCSDLKIKVTATNDNMGGLVGDDYIHMLFGLRAKSISDELVSVLSFDDSSPSDIEHSDLYVRLAMLDIYRQKLNIATDDILGHVAVLVYLAIKLPCFNGTALHEFTTEVLSDVHRIMITKEIEETVPPHSIEFIF